MKSLVLVFTVMFMSSISHADKIDGTEKGRKLLKKCQEQMKEVARSTAQQVLTQFEPGDKVKELEGPNVDQIKEAVKAPINTNKDSISYELVVYGTYETIGETYGVFMTVDLAPHSNSDAVGCFIRSVQVTDIEI